MTLAQVDRVCFLCDVVVADVAYGLLFPSFDLGQDVHMLVLLDCFCSFLER